MEGDKEMLELAAKAAGFKFEIFVNGRPIRREIYGQPVYWNPLTNDGDALRLAVKLGIAIAPGNNTKTHQSKYAVATGDIAEVSEIRGADPYAATRRAIVRAAAEIGKAMP